MKIINEGRKYSAKCKLLRQGEIKFICISPNVVYYLYIQLHLLFIVLNIHNVYVQKF